MKNKAILKVWHKGILTTLILSQGQSLTLESGHSTDEGYNRYTSRYAFIGDTVIREVDAEGKDCDGHHKHYSEHYCCLADLASQDGMPAWKKV